MIEPAELQALETAVLEAFRTGRQDRLRVLGYGEVTSVIAWPTEAPRYACKRLPPFRDGAQLDAYRALLRDYLDALRTAGIAVLPSEVVALAGDGRPVAYLVQRVIDGDRLAPRYLARCDDVDAADVLDRVIDHVVAAVGPAIGLDAQLSNWFVEPDGRLTYLDVTTPLLRDDGGRERLDADLFLASLPWALRGTVRRFMLRGILATYYDPRTVLLDAAANLHKERLTRLLPRFLGEINTRISPSIDEDEVARYYRNDARTWALLQRLRRLDRGWQLHVRRRGYPFLLPGPIER